MRYVIIFLCSLSLAACGTIKQHPEFASSWNKQYSVTVLPTKVTMKKVGILRSENMDVDLTAVDRRIKIAMEKAFANRGYVVKAVNFNTAFQRNPDLRFRLKQMHDKTKAARSKMFKKASMSDGLAETSVGPIANYFASLAGADLIAVPYYTYTERSENNMTVSLILTLGASAFNPQSVGTIELTLVDARTGKVMWTNHAVDQMSLFGQTMYKNSSDIVLADEIIHKLFKTLPDKRRSHPG